MPNNDFFNEINGWIDARVNEFDEVLKNIVADEKPPIEDQIRAVEEKLRKAERERKESDKQDALSMLNDYFFSQTTDKKSAEQPIEQIKEEIHQRRRPSKDWGDESPTPAEALESLDKKHRETLMAYNAQAAMMKEYHRKVEAEKAAHMKMLEERVAQTPGHKIISPEQVLLIEKTRDLEKSFEALVAMVKDAGGDARRASIAATDAEKAFMMLVKAITA